MHKSQSNVSPLETLQLILCLISISHLYDYDIFNGNASPKRVIILYWQYIIHIHVWTAVIPDRWVESISRRASLRGTRITSLSPKQHLNIFLICWLSCFQCNELGTYIIHARVWWWWNTRVLSLRLKRIIVYCLQIELLLFL